MNKRGIFDIFRDTLTPSRQLSAEGSSLVDLLDDDDGWQPYLRTLGPSTFSQPFAEFHIEFWDWYWRLTRMRRDKVSLADERLTFLAGWPRGGGKSSNVEWACIAEGTMGLPGYVLYVSLTQASASAHVADIRKRLESSGISRYFPDLSEPKMGKHGNRYGWRDDFLLTKGGWAIRPIGLDVAVRGFRVEDLRPTMIVFDDIDDYGLSIANVESNLQTIARSILPSGTPSTLHLIAQNLIADHCAVNKIATGRSDILTDHVPSIHKAFEELEVEKIIDEVTGKPSYEITHAIPSWEGMDINAAKVNLNKSGLEAFYAEYQHDFTLDQSEYVVPEFDDAVHVIAWTQFDAMFKTSGHIPVHWQAGIGLDIGYTADHQTAWTWLTVSAEDSDLPYAYFIYRGLTFTGKQFDEQIEVVLEHIKRRDMSTGRIIDERDQYLVSKMSHEKLGERMSLNRTYDFQFSPAQFKKEDGIPQWRSLLRPDKRKPHPFHDDVKLADGTYQLGRPSLFYVVADDQIVIPRDDKGLATHRAQTKEWRRRKVSLTNSGIQQADPMKYKDDAADSIRMLLAEEFLTATALTDLQRKRSMLRDAIGRDDLLLIPKETVRDDYTGILMKRQMEFAEVEKAIKEESDKKLKIISNIIQAPAIGRRFR